MGGAREAVWQSFVQHGRVRLGDLRPSLALVRPGELYMRFASHGVMQVQKACQKVGALARSRAYWQKSSVRRCVWVSDTVAAFQYVRHPILGEPSNDLEGGSKQALKHALSHPRTSESDERGSL